MAEGREHEAITVAARLKDFLASPSVHRPRYIRGEDPLPDGGFVLRFAQGRFPGDWPAEETALVSQAARAFVRAVCLSEGGDHYQVLCAPRGASADTIKEHYHLLMALLHPDRQEASSSAWPEGCAQRVNVAYATLGEERARRDYDATLRPRAEMKVPPRTRRRPGPAADTRFARALLVASVVTAAVVGVLATSYEDDWSDRTLLDSAVAALRLRPAHAVERPRFVGASPVPASSAYNEERSAFSFFKPLMARLAPEEPAAWTPQPIIVAPTSESKRPAISTAANDAVPVSAARAAPASVAAAEPVLRMAQAASVPASRAAADASPAEAAAARPNDRDIESLVAALVGSYEAGDAEKLVGLLDTNENGFWRRAQLRQAYDDFFRATRARRLRVDRLAWDARPGAASAKGEATLITESFDGNAPVERHVPMVLDIGMRDGRALITRLSLFPGAR